MDNNELCGHCNTNFRKCQTPCDEECTKQDQNISQCQGGQSQETGDLEQIQGSQTQEQGDQVESQGDQTQAQGDLLELQGDQTQAQGDLIELQGDQMQTQGDQTELQGDQLQTQGEQTQTQGNLSETLGDMVQYQGGETQGDQTQGEQIQTMTGHGGQTIGDQILVSTPNISAPVNVSGVNIHVSCCGEHKKDKCCKEHCKKDILSLLRLIKTLVLPITEPTSAEINFFYLGAASIPTLSNIGDIAECVFSIVPLNGDNPITILVNHFEALSIEAAEAIPNLFSTLLDYLTLLPNTFHNRPHLCDDCLESVEQQLFSYFILQQEISIYLQTTFFTGFIFKINNGIVYLVDDLVDPTIIYAIPICKITSYQTQ